MKLKHYSLWALALAFAAMSCSDDLENSGKNGTDDGNGKKAYMTINISTVSDGMKTKADPDNINTGGGAGWGEEGNGWLGELPGKNEGMVHDINIFLVETEKTTLTTDDHLDLLNTEQYDVLTAPFGGSAYKSFAGEVLDASGGVETEPNHGSRNVTVTMSKDLNEQSKTYQVFTIVNAGSDLTKKITTLGTLRNYVLTGGDNSVIKSNENKVADADKFVMSTHKMFSVKGNPPSIVSLSSKNTAENPAKTSVYVERLAARIDLAYPTPTDNRVILPNNNTDSPVHNKGTFTLTGYMVVNQWKGGTNMFKQVSPITNYQDKNINTDATYSDNENKYLGDEVWNNNSNKYNFVWSPLFEHKTSSNIKTDGSWDKSVTSGDNLAYYDNYFSIALNNKNNITTLPLTDNLFYQESNDAPTFHPIAYVRENTMNTQEQLNGFSTGVIFRTKFTPGENFTMMKYENNQIKDDVKIQNTTGFEFLTAEHYNVSTGEVQKLVYADVKTVAARAFNIVNNTDTKNLLKGFMEGWENTSTATLTEVKDAIDKMSQKNKLSEKFKKYLLEQLEGTTIDNSTMATFTNKDKLTYNIFAEKEGSYEELLTTKPLSEYEPRDIANLASEYGIYFFRDGQSYHKFWIRHDDNNDNNKMGVMEFAIVRNNVYQLNVTGVRGLGDPLPYTPGKDKPDKPDESNEVTINVTIYVKDWVKRKNADIIL